MSDKNANQTRSNEQRHALIHQAPTVASGSPWFRLLVAGAGATLVAFVVALAELSWINDSGTELGFARTFALFGLLAPPAVLLGLLVGVVALFQPPQAVGLLIFSRLDKLPAERRAVFNGRAIALTGGAMVCLVGFTDLALREFLMQRGGLALALMLCVVFVGALGASLGVARQLATLRWLKRARPSFVSGGCLVIGLLGVVVLAMSGPTTGGGGSVEAFGVLRRQELDLSLPLALLAVVAVAYQASAFGARALGVASGLVLLFAGWAFLGADAAFADASLRTGTEQGGRATRLALARYQAASDTDQDGFSAAYGGGDCDDTNPKVNPEAVEVPGNAIDDDCVGGDGSAEGKEPDDPRRAAGMDVPGSTTATAAATASPTRLELPKRVNIVLISIDTLRFDLGFMGYERPISPNIDALASRSFIYQKAYALASYTSKSLGPTLIGRYGSETHRGWMHFNRYPARDKMIQERLEAGGVRTVSVQAHWYFKANTGLGRGFSVLDMQAAPRVPQAEGDRTVTSKMLTDRALAHLEDLQSQSQPYFLWVHYLDPHADYVPHAAHAFGKSQRDLYDGEVAFTDQQVGRLLDGIAAGKNAAQTVIILTSDHGEAFREHGMIRHGFELWEELVRVPLIVHVPGAEPRRFETRRSLIDLAPTLLELFGLDAPTDEEALSGTSWVADWQGSPLEQRPVFIDMPAGPYNGDRQSYIDNDLKLTTSRSRPMGLYDLAQDPGEKKNLMKDAERTRAALDRFKAFRSRLRRVYVKPQKR